MRPAMELRVERELRESAGDGRVAIDQ